MNTLRKHPLVSVAAADRAARQQATPVMGGSVRQKLS
jgi:hypothetical protein